MTPRTSRRTFIAQLTAAAAATPLAFAVQERAPRFRLGVQQYSFNHALRNGELDPLDYPKTVVEGTGIKHLEYYNGHYMDKAGNTKWFQELRQRGDDLGVTNEFMLCRSKNALDSPERAIRDKAVEEYKPWLDGMKRLGGWGIRVDTRHKGDFEEQKRYAVEGLVTLCNAAKQMDMTIMVENHGGHSGNGLWVADVMERVALDNCGTLPDFQNFKAYDPYKGVKEMMPYAKAVCAKAKAFDAQGNESNVDYARMMGIVKDAGFSGYIGIEYEGHDPAPVEGILATKRLLEKVW